MDINDRISLLITELGMTPYQFAKALGYERVEKIYTVVNKRNKPGYDTLVGILERFDQVSAEWLMMGRGGMFKSARQPEATEPPTQTELEGVEGKDYAIKRESGVVTILVDKKSGEENIVMVDTRAAAGYPQGFLEPEYLTDLPHFSLPSPQFRNGTFRCFQVSGDSMAETVFDGDWVIASYVELDGDLKSLSAIKKACVYVIVTHEDVLVKRLLNRVEEQGELILVSDNEAYPARRIKAEDLRELWCVKAKLSFYLPNTRFNAYKRINSLEADVINLQERVKRLESTK